MKQGMQPLLAEGEAPLLEGAPNRRYAAWAGFFDGAGYPVLFGVVALVVVGVSSAMPAGTPWGLVTDEVSPFRIAFLIVGFGTVGGTFIGVRSWLRLRRSCWAVTRHSVYESYRGLTSRVQIISVSKITDIGFHQSIAGRIMGVWNVELGTDGASMQLHAVEDPHRVRALLYDLTPENRATKIAPLVVRTPEVELVSITPSWRAIAATVLASSVATGLLAFSPEWFALLGYTPAFASLSRLAVILALVGGVWQYAFYARARYVVTTRRVRSSRSFLAKRVYDFRLEGLTDVTLKRTILGRLFGYGALHLASTSGDRLTLRGLRNPEETRELIDRAREALP